MKTFPWFALWLPLVACGGRSAEPPAGPLSLAATKCQAVACAVEFVPAAASFLRCDLSAEAVLADSAGGEFRIWSREVSGIDFAGGASVDVTLDFSEGMALLPQDAGPYQVRALTGAWLARCHGNEVEMAAPAVDGNLFYGFGEVKGWTTQTLWASESVRCMENPSLPDSRSVELGAGTAMWVNRLKPNFYFVDAAGVPWIWVNVPGRREQCYVAARRGSVVRENPAPPPPFRDFHVACEAVVSLESGDLLKFSFPDLKVMESRGELTFASTPGAATTWLEVPMGLAEIGVDGETMSSISPRATIFSEASELPPDLAFDLPGVSRILEVHNNGRGFGPFLPGRIGLVVANSVRRGAEGPLPAFQMFLRRDPGQPPLLSHPARCRKME